MSQPLVIAALLAAIALVLGWLLRAWRTRPRKRRGANAHVNADGSAKRRYRSRRSAQRAAREYERDFGGRMSTYRCRRGRHWHIGHTK